MPEKKKSSASTPKSSKPPATTKAKASAPEPKAAAPKASAPKPAAAKPTTTKVAAKPAPAVKPAAKPRAAKPASPAIAPSTQLIDTSLAAQNAARMLAAGVSGRAQTSPPTAPQRQESALFKQLKSGLNKPHSTAMSNLLDKTHGPSPHKTPSFQKQVGKHQTSGADPTRSGVPRRTAG